MRRVASLYLPYLPTERLADQLPPTSFDAPAALPAARERGPVREHGGWRPGARWAQQEEEPDPFLRARARSRARKAAIQAEIETLPLHQRPPMRELGRRSEPAPHPFRANSPEAKDQEESARGAYDLAGAFWEQGRTLGKIVAKAVEQPAPPVRLPARPGDGVPFVTAERSGQRIIIAATNPAAESLGLAPGMPLASARAMVPGLLIRDADPQAENEVLTRLALHAARYWTPGASVSDPTGLWLDFTGVDHLWGGERRFCARILRFCARLGYSARIAVAGTTGAAHALARSLKQPIVLCPSGDEEAAIAGFPVKALRIGDDLSAAAIRLGLDTIGSLAATPRGPLQRRFGKAMLTRLDQALGNADEPIAPLVPKNAPSATLRLLEPIGTAEAIGQVIDDAVGELVLCLEERGEAARRIALGVKRVDGGEQWLAIGTARPTRDANHLRMLLKMKLDRIEPGFGIEEVRLVGGLVEPLRPQMLGEALGTGPQSADIAPLIDKLEMRLGAGRVYRVSSVESDVPERSVRKIKPLDQPIPWPDAWPRPPRLLPRPEPIGNVMADLPDSPPKRFTWRGKTHMLVKGDGPERIYGEWWKRAGERDAVRDYFRVEDETGARYWLFRRGDGHDPRTGDMSWWLQGGCG